MIVVVYSSVLVEAAAVMNACTCAFACVEGPESLRLPDSQRGPGMEKETDDG